MYIKKWFYKTLTIEQQEYITKATKWKIETETLKAANIKFMYYTPTDRDYAFLYGAGNSIISVPHTIEHSCLIWFPTSVSAIESRIQFKNINTELKFLTEKNKKLKKHLQLLTEENKKLKKHRQLLSKTFNNIQKEIKYKNKEMENLKWKDLQEQE